MGVYTENTSDTALNHSVPINDEETDNRVDLNSPVTESTSDPRLKQNTKLETNHIEAALEPAIQVPRAASQPADENSTPYAGADRNGNEKLQHAMEKASTEESTHLHSPPCNSIDNLTTSLSEDALEPDTVKALIDFNKSEGAGFEGLVMASSSPSENRQLDTRPSAAIDPSCQLRAQSTTNVMEDAENARQREPHINETEAADTQ